MAPVMTTNTGQTVAVQLYLPTERSAILSLTGHQRPYFQQDISVHAAYGAVVLSPSATIHSNRPDVNSSSKLRAAAAFRATASQVSQRETNDQTSSAYSNCRGFASLPVILFFHLATYIPSNLHSSANNQLALFMVKEFLLFSFFFFFVTIIVHGKNRRKALDIYTTLLLTISSGKATNVRAFQT